MGTIRTGTTRNRRPPADQSPADGAEDGDLAVLDRDSDHDAPGHRPSRVERRDWRGEGVVGRFHTD